MRTDTDALRGFAARIRALRQGSFSGNTALDTHLAVQASLDRLALWFEDTASRADWTESTLAAISSPWKPGRLHTSHSEVWNLGQQLKQRPVKTTLTGSVSTAVAQGHWLQTGQHHQLDTQVDLVKFKASGKAAIQLWDKQKKKVPSAELQAEASLSAASFAGNYKVFAGRSASAALNLKGEAGALYAKAEAVLSAQEQSLDLAVGAAAFRGECSLAFSLFGATITLTGEGSIGSCEASMSYRHKNREWEFGSKLGFIAGTGFRLKVSY
ncbi:hypothetical protein [uncultured Faecalibaculum sp.]|uniref:hypothetical protein n=1 Tax=uncultured Faecalibaculum sp. TaxID=1729681 RepID=UPI0025E85C33|nr:hypothetical protein [uncultured Faecalibaculum sp.]